MFNGSNNVFSKYQCGFRKDQSSEQFTCTTWNMETNVDQAKVFGTLLTDFSKAFDYLPLDLFLAKLQAYWFDNKSLGFVQEQVQVQDCYLSYRKVLYIFTSVIKLLSWVILIWQIF